MTTALKLTVTNQSNYYKRYNSTVNTFAYAVQTHAAFKYEVTAKIFINLHVTASQVYERLM